MSEYLSERPRLLLLSHVLPFPGNAGQQMRVRNTLAGLRPHFHVTFLTTATIAAQDETRRQLLEWCDEAIVWPSLFHQSQISRTRHRVAGTIFSWKTGLKTSNYTLGCVEFSPGRLRDFLKETHFDVALFEYWHAADTARVFQEKNIPCALDMHDILWQSYMMQLGRRRAPEWWKQRAFRLYKSAEEASWSKFDLLVSINDAEHDYAQEKVAPGTPFINAYMGVDTAQWPYLWQPSAPPRLVYYGGLATVHNQRDALICHNEVMPLVWQEYPEAELWIVGGKPPAHIQALTADARVHVTGFVEDVHEILKTMTVMLCPWTGKFGFRSRLMEAMSTGVPVIASHDAVYGMGTCEGEGLFLEDTAEGMAQQAMQFLKDADFAQAQSRAARAQVERKYSFDATYGHLARELKVFVQQRQAQRSRA